MLSGTFFEYERGAFRLNEVSDWILEEMATSHRQAPVLEIHMKNGFTHMLYPNDFARFKAAMETFWTMPGEAGRRAVLCLI